MADSLVFITGVAGSGKTSFLCDTFLNKIFFDSLSDYLECKKEISILKENGFPLLDLPPQRHLCYADFSMKANLRNSAYHIDGFEIGLPNPFFKTAFIPPCSTIFIDEGQRYWDSRMSAYIREEVYGWFELRRHNKYKIFIACHKIGNIDLRIRSLADYVIVIDKIDIKKDGYGRVKTITWFFHKFTSCDNADKYVMSCEKNNKSDIGSAEKLVSNFNVFKHYDSYGNKPYFYLNNENRPFEYYSVDGYEFTLESFQEFNNTHFFSAPQGYYKNAKRDNEILNKTKDVTTNGYEYREF